MGLMGYILQAAARVHIAWPTGAIPHPRSGAAAKWSYGTQSMGGCDSAQSMAERSYPKSEVRGKSWEDPMPAGQRPRGVTPCLRPEVVAGRSYPT